MAKCATCGKKAGFFSNTCVDCEKAAADAAVSETRLDAERVINERLEAIKQTKRKLHERLQRGEHVFLYFTAYVPIDSIIVDQPAAPPFDPQIIVQMGLNGWDLVGTLPKTSGVALTNYTQGLVTAWGAGLGGNVVGAYLIFKKAVVSVDPARTDDELAAIIGMNRLERDAIIEPPQNA